MRSAQLAEFLSENKEVYMPNLDDRAQKAGLSLLQIARRTGIHAWRLYGGYELTLDEVARLNAVLAEGERKRSRYPDAAYV
jgi:hypothetical protein